MISFSKEKLVGEQVRYYLETGGNKYYLMVTSNGNMSTLNADDLVLNSQNDIQTRFTNIYI